MLLDESRIGEGFVLLGWEFRTPGAMDGYADQEQARRAALTAVSPRLNKVRGYLATLLPGLETWPVQIVVNEKDVGRLEHCRAVVGRTSQSASAEELAVAYGNLMVTTSQIMKNLAQDVWTNVGKITANADTIRNLGAAAQISVPMYAPLHRPDFDTHSRDLDILIVDEAQIVLDRQGHGHNAVAARVCPTPTNIQNLQSPDLYPDIPTAL